MASTGAVGGSQIDVQSLVSQLVAADRAPQDAILQNREIKLTSKISAVAMLKGSLSNFQSALDSLRSASVYDARTATSAKTDVFTASASASAAAGSYEIEVLDLAQAHQLRSGPIVGGSGTTIGTGTLTIGVGDASFDVEIADGQKSLAGIAAAINKAADNKGVQATLINGVDGARLVLTASRTGEDAKMTVKQAGGDGGLASLVYDPGTTTNLVQVQAASDARISIAGVEAKSTSNVFTDAIEGVTISLKSKPAVTDPPTTVKLSIERNPSAAKDAVKKFVATYNAMQKELSAMRAYNPETKTAGALIGDPILRGVEDEVKRALSTPISGLTGEHTTLASLGVKTNSSGQLELDDAKYTAATSADPSIVSRIFGGENGMTERLYDLLGDKLASGASIDAKNKGLNDSLKQIEKQKEALNIRMVTVQQRYLKQFTALDTMLSGMQSTSAYLSQQLSKLPGASS